MASKKTTVYLADLVHNYLGSGSYMFTESSIHELWHGEKMTALRDSLSKGFFEHQSCCKCANRFYKRKGEALYAGV